MNRSILTRLVALLVVTALGVYYIAFDVVGVKLVDQPFTVKVDMAAAGGVYTDASVTYRGVEIGKVASLQLEPKGVVAVLHIDRGAKVPADVKASVRELTAAAEQYMDLVPTGPTQGYLHQGSVITDSSIPVTVGTLLNTVNTLVDSLSASDLNTLSSALAQGLGQGAGEDLRSIITDGNDLVTALQSAIPGTVQLIDAGNTVLGTFNQTSPEFEQFSANLNSLTGELANDNSKLVGVLDSGSTASQNLSTFLDQNATPTANLIDDLETSTGVAYARQGAIQALFGVLPLFATDVASVTTGGQIRFEVDFNDKNTVCPYTSTMVEPTSLVASANLAGNCRTEAPDLLQRGADKAPAPSQG